MAEPSRNTVRPILLDLFCKAGGAAMGYHRAGFDVVGVDIEEQPNYPFNFIQGDAIAYLAINGIEFNAIHASPPCQGYTTMSVRHRGQGGKADTHTEMIKVTRELLKHIGQPWIIENVAGARRDMPDAVTLHGGMFGLGVDRPRLFDGPGIIAPPKALRVKNPVGVYGKLDGRRLWTRKDGTELRAARTLEQASAAMGIDWMTWDELTQAIPPAYTEHIGRQLIQRLGQVAA